MGFPMRSLEVGEWGGGRGGGVMGCPLLGVRRLEGRGKGWKCDGSVLYVELEVEGWEEGV